MLRKFLDYSFKLMNEPAPGEPPAGEPAAPEAPVDPAADPGIVKPGDEPTSLMDDPAQKTQEQINEEKYNEFVSKLPDDFKNDPSLQVHKSFDTLIKSYVHAQKAIGADKVVVPGKHATDEDWQNVYKKLGLPENEAEYKISLPEEAQISEEFTKAFAPQAHKLGILPKQAEGLLSWYDQLAKEQMENFGYEATQRQEAQMEDLRNSWGTKFVDNMTRAKETFDLFADKDVRDFFESNNLAKEPAVIKLMANVSESLKEDVFKGREPLEKGMDAAAAQSELNSLMGDPKSPYYNKNHPGHTEAVARVTKLMEAVN